MQGIQGIAQGIHGIAHRMAAIEAAIADVGGRRATAHLGGASSGAVFAATLDDEVRSAAAALTGGATSSVTGAAAAGTSALGLAALGATGTAPGATAPLGTGALPAVDGFTAEQVGNAAAVVAAGQGMGLSLRDQAIGVMTAIGESSLRVLDRGDAVGPDSRGLFQQRDNGAWGTYAERMDPTASAQSFFRALQRVGGRDAMAPTLVAHTVQRNADPQHYARSWDSAVALVARLTGASPAQVAGT